MRVLPSMTVTARVIGWTSWLLGPMAIALGFETFGIGFLALGILGWAYER